MVLICSVAGTSLLAGAAGADEHETRGSPLLPIEAAWTTDLGGPPAAGPAYDTTHAYVPLRDGRLTAVRLYDGIVAWSLEQATRFAPTAGDGLVVVTDSTTLTGIRGVDGRPLWRTDMGAAVSAPPLWTTGWLIVVLETGEVVALRGVDGHELWRLPLGGTLHVRPSVSGRRLFVPVEDGRIVAIELATGAALWERTLAGAPQEILPLDALFVGSTDNYFYRLSLESGAVDWRWRNGGDVVGAPTVDERRVYFLSLDNILRSLDRRSGVQQWRQPLNARPTAGPVKIGPLILIAGVAPRVRLFDTAAGSVAGTFDAPGELAATPHAVSGLSDVGLRLVILTGDGRLVAFQRAQGPAQFTLGFPPAPLLPVPDRLALADVLPFPPVPTAGPTTVHTGVPPARQLATGGFGVQVAALRDATSAAMFADFLVQRGFDAFVVGPTPDSADQLHRVRVGRHLARPEAERLAARIRREEALDTFIVQTP